MKKLLKSSLATGLFLGSVVLFSSCNEELEVVQTINEEYYGINEIEIESGFLEVNYQGVEGQESITLEGLLESSKGNNFRIDISNENGKLRVELDQKGVFGGGRNRGHIYLVGPKDIDLDVEGGSGKIYVSRIDYPNLEVSVGSGTMEINNSSASEMKFEVGSGTILGSDLTGNLIAQAGSGTITFRNVLGDAKITASSGLIDIKNILGSLNSEVSSGRIVMNEVDEIQSLKVSSGSVEGLQVGLGPKTVLSGSSGYFKLQTFSLLSEYNYDFQAGSGRVVVGESSSSGSLKINNGSSFTITGSVSSGNIEIRN